MTSLTGDDVRHIRHLSTLDVAEAKRVAEEIVVHTYAPRELVMVEGEPCLGFYQLVSGRARLYRTGPEGREQIMRLLQPPDTFGEVAVFDAGPSPASVETLEETTILLIPSITFRRLVDTHPAVAMDLLGHFARRLRSFTELVEQISMQTVQQRVARYLYLAAREEGHQTPEGVVVNRSITLQDLAALVGSVREVVSRTLHIIETDGLVEVRRKEIVIRDVAGLKRLLEEGANPSCARALRSAIPMFQDGFVAISRDNWRHPVARKSRRAAMPAMASPIGQSGEVMVISTRIASWVTSIP